MVAGVVGFGRHTHHARGCSAGGTDLRSWFRRRQRRCQRGREASHRQGVCVMSGRLSGKVCIITGTGGSMGRDAAQVFAREGASVVGCDLGVDAAQATVDIVRAAGGTMASLQPCHLTKPDARTVERPRMGERDARQDAARTSRPARGGGKRCPVPGLEREFLRDGSRYRGRWRYEGLVTSMRSVERSGTFQLGDLRVRRLGYGAMHLSGAGIFGPPKDRDAALAVLREAVAAGVNHIDTSDYYGPHVTNQLIREALHPSPEDPVLLPKD